MNELQTRYPLIFVHGMFGWGANEGINSKAPYWGGTTGNLMDYLRDKGVECCAASVGPVSSVWDQACELYAQLKGTRVDYGEHHSRIHGHKRFGRTYTRPLIENWSKEKKIHLIGHSFGGNTARLLAHLLKYGSPEEIAESGDDTSPLFVGGNEELVCSVTAICSPLNGTEAYETAQRYKLLAPMKFICLGYISLMGRTKIQGSLVDFHLEQYGVNDTDTEKHNASFTETFRRLLNSADNIEYDMSGKGAKKMNEIINAVPSVYYFSYPYNAVEENEKGKKVPKNIDFLFLKGTSGLMLRNNEKANKMSTGNDGLVDVASAMHPQKEPFKAYCENEPVVPGVWHVMPVKKGDHGTPIGLLSDKEETHKFYGDLIALLNSVESNRNLKTTV